MKTSTNQIPAIEKISQVYVGKDAHCRCGCAGNYTSSSHAIEPRSRVSDAYVQTQITRAKNLILQGLAKVEVSGNYVNVSYGTNRAITFYIDEVSK